MVLKLAYTEVFLSPQNPTDFRVTFWEYDISVLKP